MQAVFDKASDGAAGQARAAEALVDVEDLTVAFHDRELRRPVPVVTGVSFSLRPGRVTALIGESGSGKSVTARALVGLNGTGAVVTAGRLLVQGKSVLGNGEMQWRRLRGREIGFILQDALTSLDPLRTIAKEVAEPLEAHAWGTGRQRNARVLATLERAGLADPGQFLTRRAGELSGGQRQRALIAQATVLDPPVLIADEPTTALDSTIQGQILALFETLRNRGHAILLITHDLGVVSRLADEVLVLRSGRVIETGPTEQILKRPAQEYTRELIRAIPNPARRRARLLADRLLAEPARQAETPVRAPDPGRAAEPAPAVEVRNLVKSYPIAYGGRIVALNDVSFSARHGETLGIVGESGSGKSTLSWILAGLRTFDAGTVKVLGRSWDDVAGQDAFRHRRSVQVVYQDPLGSFDPRHAVGQVLVDAIRPDRTVDPRDHEAIAVAALRDVSLSTDLWHRNPLTLSGGQRQRLSIARALVTGAQLLVLDEPVSALDATIQAQVLDLLKDLQEQRSLTYVFVSHDLGVVHHMSHDVIVLRNGLVVEQGSSDQIFHSPQTEYAKTLVAAVPKVNSFLDE